jgi:hypothetical protein
MTMLVRMIVIVVRLRLQNRFRSQRQHNVTMQAVIRMTVDVASVPMLGADQSTDER